MTQRIASIAGVSILAGVVVAGLFSMTVEPLRSVGWVSIPLWLAVAGMVLAGALVSLAMVDLKPVFGTGLAASVIATLLYAFAIWYPSMSLPHYSTRLANYAMVQSLPVLLIALVSMMAGAVLGTVVNTTLRDYEL